MSKPKDFLVGLLLVPFIDCSSGGASTPPLDTADLAQPLMPDLAQPLDDLAMPNDLAVPIKPKPAVFTRAATITGLKSARCLLSVELTGDKQPDLVACSTFDQNVQVYRNGGKFMFAKGASISTPDYPISLAAGDVNKDGSPDVGVASFIGGKHTILLGDGKGNLSATATLIGNSYPNDIQIGDLDGDGTLDVLGIELGMGNGGKVLSLFKGMGGGRFAAATTLSAGTGPAGAVIADFNRDGRMDIVSSGFQGGTYSAHLGMMGGTFGAPQTTAALRGPRLLAAADFDRDGNLDVAMTFEGPTPGHVGVYLGKGDGSFAAAIELPVGSDPYGIGVFDANQDGKPDLYVANINSSDVSILIGRGDGGFEAAQQITVDGNAYAASAADFDGDGKIDLAVSASTQIVVLRNETP